MLMNGYFSNNITNRFEKESAMPLRIPFLPLALFITMEFAVNAVAMEFSMSASAKSYSAGVLIDEGVACSTIMISSNADAGVQYAAADIQKVFGEMTGVTLPVACDNEPIKGNRILVGATCFTDAVVPPAERADLGKEGYIVRLKGRDLALAADYPYGAIYAAAELYDRLGARWYMPGELGACIPRLETIRFDSLDVKRIPSFEMREMGANDTDWFLHNRLNNINDPDLPPAFVVYPGIFATQPVWVPVEKYYETHPEFFKLIASIGTRSDSPTAKLCNSNPDLPSVIAGNMVAALQEHPGISLLSLSPTDGRGYCNCDPCKALHEDGALDGQSESKPQMTLYSRVAKILETNAPGQTLLVGAYSDYAWPPKDPTIKAGTNIAVVLCQSGCMAHSVDDPACPENCDYDAVIRAWQAQTPHIYFYEYYNKVAWFGAPWPIVHCIERDIPYFKSIGAEGLHTQRDNRDMWGTFLDHYVAARLLWDHTTDVPAVLEDFYQKFYGKASGPMKRWYETLEHQMAATTNYFSGRIMMAGQNVFTPEVMAIMKQCIDEAQSLADDDLTQRRVAKMKVLTEYTARYVSYFQLRQEADALKGDARNKVLLESLNILEDLFADTLKPKSEWTGIVLPPDYTPKGNLRTPHNNIVREITTVRTELKKEGVTLPPERSIKAEADDQ